MAQARQSCLSRVNENVYRLDLREWEELSEECANKLADLLRSDAALDAALRKLSEEAGIVDYGHYYLRARSYVGAALLKGAKFGLLLVVSPKVAEGPGGLNRLANMLKHSDDERLRRLGGLVGANGTELRDMLDFTRLIVVDEFTRLLQETLAYGFPELPETKVVEEALVRGRPLIRETMRSLMSPRPAVVQEVTSYSAENDLSRYVLGAANKLLVSNEYRQALDAIEAARLGSAGPSALIARALLELDYQPLPNQGLKYSDLERLAPMDRPYVSELLFMAAVINEGLPSVGGRAPGLWIDMNVVFEGFARGLLRVAAEGLGLRVQRAPEGEQCQEGSSNLFLRGPKVYCVHPDIVIIKDSATMAVGDVKYRDVKDPVEEDRDSVYQIYSYASAYNARRMFLVYPSLEGKGTRPEGPYVTFDRKEFYIIRLDLAEATSDEDVRRTSTYKELVELLETLVQA